MKPFKLAILFTATLLSSATFATVSLKGEIAAVAPYDWTGFYAGLNAGAMSHTMNITDNQATSFNATIQQVSNPNFTGGFQLGYRRQLDLTKASGVYGVEFSANFANTSFTQEYGSPFALYQLETKSEVKNPCLLELIGGIAADRTLLFMAAGLSWTNITGNVTNLTGIPFTTSYSLNKKALGGTFGGGIEYAFTNHISARIKIDYIKPNTYTVHDNLDNRFQIANSIVQGTLGVNYNFA